MRLYLHVKIGIEPVPCSEYDPKTVGSSTRCDGSLSSYVAGDVGRKNQPNMLAKLRKKNLRIAELEATVDELRESLNKLKSNKVEYSRCPILDSEAAEGINGTATQRMDTEDDHSVKDNNLEIRLLTLQRKKLWHYHHSKGRSSCIYCRSRTLARSKVSVHYDDKEAALQMLLRRLLTSDCRGHRLKPCAMHGICPFCVLAESLDSQSRSAVADTLLSSNGNDPLPKPSKIFTSMATDLPGTVVVQDRTVPFYRRRLCEQHLMTWCDLGWRRSSIDDRSVWILAQKNFPLPKPGQYDTTILEGKVDAVLQNEDLTTARWHECESYTDDDEVCVHELPAWEAGCESYTDDNKVYEHESSTREGYYRCPLFIQDSDRMPDQRRKPKRRVDLSGFAQH